MEIFPPASYLKKYTKFRTTTNRIKIAFSANRPLATHKSKMCEQNAIYLMKGQKNKICITNCWKSAKMPITVCKFSKIFRGNMPPDPPRIIFVSLFASNLTLPEKIRLKKVKIRC